MVDSKTSIEQSILDKIRSRETPVVEEEASPDPAGCVSAIRGSTVARWLAFQGETIVVPRLTAEEEQEFALLMDEMAAAKAADPDADMEQFEWAIDRLVYDLYGLTEEEDTLIERSLGLIFQTDEEEDAALARMANEALADPANVADEASQREFREILRSWRSEAGV